MSDRESLDKKEMSLLSHLAELRQRLLYSLIAIGVVFVGLISFSQNLYHQLAKPLLRYLPSDAPMIATQVAAPFIIPLKLTGVVSIFIAMPFVLYQLWRFVLPGLYLSEKRLALPLLLASIILFYLGVAFAYFVVLPIVFKFFVGSLPQGVAMMTDMSHYLDFVITFFLAFGITFEAPVITLLLVLLKVVTVEQLSRGRPYIIVGIFIVGALLTPPDVLSQVLLSIPLWALFESGLYIAKVYERF